MINSPHSKFKTQNSKFPSSPHLKFKTQNSKLNLRSLLILVICLTGISVIYQHPLIQFSILLITTILLLVFKPTAKSRKQLFVRLSHVGRIIMVIFIFQLLFRRTGNVIWEFGIIRITDLGFNYALASSLRFFIIILAAGLLMDYPFQDYLIALNAWKFPYEIAFIVAATIHFLPIFRTTFNNKMETLALRNISLKELNLSQRIRAFRILLLPVIASAIHNIQYRAISLEMRAFRLFPNRTYFRQQKLQLRDYVIIYASLIIALLFIILLSF